MKKKTQKTTKKKFNKNKYKKNGEQNLFVVSCKIDLKNKNLSFRPRFCFMREKW